MKRNVLIIWLSPLVSEASHKVLLNSRQWMLRNRPDNSETDRSQDRRSSDHMLPRNVFVEHNNLKESSAENSLYMGEGLGHRKISGVNVSLNGEQRRSWSVYTEADWGLHWFKNHQFINKDEFGHVTTASSQTEKPDLPTEICTKHHGKLIDMFCEDHDLVGCSVCMALDHRSCKDLCYIPDIARSRVSDENVQTVQQDLSSQIDKIKFLQQDRKKHISRLQAEKDLALNEVRERRKVIDEYLDTYENATNSEITDKHGESSGKLRDDIDLCDDCIASLETMSVNIQKSESYNASQTFVNIKRTERLIQKTELKRLKCNDNENNLPSIVVEVSNNADYVLSQEIVFGRIRSYNKVPKGLKHMDTITIKYNKDKSTCTCCDLCELPDGTIILTDWENQSVKSLKYSATYKLADSLKMSNSTWGVCCVNEHVVAVTVPHDQTVNFVSVVGSLAINNSFKVTSQCYGIVHVQGLLYIGNGSNSKITVYDLDGKFMNTISTDQTGSALFRNPLHLCLWPGKQYIVVAGLTKGVVVVDILGDCVAQYTYPARAITFGVCFDEDGNMIIADSSTREIIALGINTYTINTTTTVLTTTDKIPRSVNFQKTTNRLFVTYKDSDHIDIFSLVF